MPGYEVEMRYLDDADPALDLEDNIAVLGHRHLCL